MSKRSLCFTCKFGLCVRQSEKAIIITDGDEPAEPKNEWESEKSKSSPGHAEIQSEGYVSLCYWKPEFLKTSKETVIHPVQFELVHECNRYEKNSPKKDLPKDDSEL